MKYDFAKTLTDLKNKEILEADATVSMAALCQTALLAVHEADRDLSGPEKFKRFKLANRLLAESVLEVTAEEVANMKELVGRQFPPLIVGRVYEFLENPIANNANTEQPELTS